MSHIVAEGSPQMSHFPGDAEIEALLAQRASPFADADAAASPRDAA
ncbi:hypothetical protein SAMN05216466_11731 [Paraburkholderia phenazinium]|uniref:Uncharacterized protein n=1 Tax=Paraburkholderia phenazinium TaxID=60549 RepID=A0A1G8HQI9_9BURK|nr:hypothetical protein SAMN05216466_11731 [Paraburkholderia phenazinium]